MHTYWLHNVILLLYQIINKGFFLFLKKMWKSYYDEQLNYIFAQGREYNFKAQ